jgi:hypothetical protein
MPNNSAQSCERKQMSTSGDDTDTTLAPRGLADEQWRRFSEEEKRIIKQRRRIYEEEKSLIEHFRTGALQANEDRRRRVSARLAARATNKPDISVL